MERISHQKNDVALAIGMKMISGKICNKKEKGMTRGKRKDLFRIKD